MATYYIDESGVDDAGRSGLTTGTAWATLSYACTRVTNAGDTIYVNPGTYTETSQSVLAVGVSIMGAGVTSIITTASALNPIILLDSPAEGIEGNQSISYLKFDGDLTANRGIRINARSNIKIHHCQFLDFVENAIIFCGKIGGSPVGEPTIYASGNYIYDNTFTNCSYEWFSSPYYYASGAIGVGGQKDMLIYNNTIDCVTGSRHGYGIKYFYDGFNKGLKIYDNNITIAAKTVASYQYSFAIELWFSTGGLEIYNNTIIGAIDVVNAVADIANGYNFAGKIYNNSCTFTALQTYSQTGIMLERTFTGGFYVYNNYVANQSTGIGISQMNAADVVEDLIISYNILHETTRLAGTAIGSGIQWTGSVALIPYTRVKIYNNVMTSYSFLAHTGIRCEAIDIVLTDTEIKNNIIIGYTNAIKFENNTVTGIDIWNNCINDCTNNYDFTPTDGVTDDVYQDNLEATDPLFVNAGIDYSLQDTSPCIDSGVDVGILTDFVGTLVPFGSAPDIGAHEWFEVEYDFSNITLVNTPACYNAVDNTIISRWVATECPINFTLLRRDWYITNSADVGGFLAVSVYGSFTGNDGDVISVYDLTTNSMYTGTITDKSGDPVLITDIPYVSGMDIKYLNDHTLYAGYYFEGRLTINGVVETLTVIASPDSFGYADLDVSGILRIKTSIGKVTNYLSLIQKDTNKSGHFTLEYRGCWYGSNEAYITEGSQTSPASEVVWYYAECVRSEEQGCNLAEYVPTDLNDAPFLNQFDTPVYWYGLPFDLSFILPERAELSPTSDIIVTMKVYNSANVQMGADIVQTIDVDSLEGYVNSLNIDSTLIDAGAAYFTVEIFSM